MTLAIVVFRDFLQHNLTACHYVTNNQEENDSKVYNFTMSEYFEHKQALQAGVGIGDYAR